VSERSVPRESLPPPPFPGPARRYTVGLGANLGDRIPTLLAAIAAIASRVAEGPAPATLPAPTALTMRAAHPTRPIRLSSWWQSPSEGGPGPDYVNAALAFESRLEPQQLLEALLAIEASLGRVRAQRNAPRTVDLDILLVDDLRIDTSSLVVPHPRMHLRAFVLLPLLELDPAAHIPGIGAARTALQALGPHACQRVDAHLPPCGTIRP